MNKKKDIVTRVGVVIIKKKSVLAVQHKVNDREFWVLPGGGIEFGETIPECCEREVLEETGLVVKFNTFSYVNEYLPEGEHVINIIVTANLIRGKIKVGKDPDHASQVLKKVAWISIKELNDIKFYPKFLADKINNGLCDVGKYIEERT